MLGIPILWLGLRGGLGGRRGTGFVVSWTGDGDNVDYLVMPSGSSDETVCWTERM